MINPFEVLEARLSNIESLLLDMKHKPKLAAESEQLTTERPLTVEGAANFLQLSTHTIYSLVSRREIPSMKRGNRLYFDKQTLTEWLNAGRKKTNAELSEEASTRIVSKRKGGKIYA